MFTSAANPIYHLHCIDSELNAKNALEEVLPTSLGAHTFPPPAGRKEDGIELTLRAWTSFRQTNKVEIQTADVRKTVDLRNPIDYLAGDSREKFNQAALSTSSPRHDRMGPSNIPWTRSVEGTTADSVCY